MRKPGWMVVAVALTAASMAALGQAPPGTAGETLSGKKIVLADAVRGHPVILVAGFSREGGNRTGAWVKAIHGDSALAGTSVYQVAEIAGAPGLIRGMIKSGMKRNVPAAEHDSFVVLTQDEKAWREYFGVTDDQAPYVTMIDVDGKVLWRGHGGAEIEPQLRAAAR